MYCRRCYNNISGATGNMCPRCGRSFDPNNPATFRARPFPSRPRIALHLLLTIVIGLAVAFFVALFQVAGADGH
jgi:hypothetical protein